MIAFMGKTPRTPKIGRAKGRKLESSRQLSYEQTLALARKSFPPQVWFEERPLELLSLLDALRKRSG